MAAPKGSQVRRGVAAVELAVCLPLLFIILMGLWEVGRMVSAQQLIANAAREGGRQAAAGQKDPTAIKQFVANYLTLNGISGVTSSNVTVTNLTSASRNDPRIAEQMDHFRVTVTVPYSNIRYSNLAQITSTANLGYASDWYSMRDVPITVTGVIPTK